MKKKWFRVWVSEVHQQEYFVVASTAQEAINKLENDGFGEAVMGDNFEPVTTLEPDNSDAPWFAEEADLSITLVKVPA